jgi:hypothetical protein
MEYAFTLLRRVMVYFWDDQLLIKSGPHSLHNSWDHVADMTSTKIKIIHIKQERFISHQKNKNLEKRENIKHNLTNILQWAWADLYKTIPVNRSQIYRNKNTKT